MMVTKIMRLFYCFMCFLLVILIGCTNPTESFPTETPNNLSPTIVDTNTPTSTPEPTYTPSPTIDLSTPDIKLTNVRYVMIYSDEFNPDWELIQNNDVETNIEAKTLFNSGTQSIAITPKIGLSRTNFVVKEDASKYYPRDKIFGFRFWINPANGYIKPSNLLVNIIGSNDYSYYVDGDDSVNNNTDPASSETPLDNLGYNQIISPETWFEVIILLDDFAYYIDYEYIVGFYIKNAEGFLQTFYIDDIQLIIEEGESIPLRPTSTSTFTLTYTITPTPTSTPTQGITPYQTPTPTGTKKPPKPKPTKIPTAKPTPTLASP